MSAKVNIDPRAAIDPSATIGAGSHVGPFAMIGPNVVIGENCQIDAFASVHQDTSMGNGNHIYSYASVGADPQDMTYDGSETRLEIGDNNIIREYVSINRGSPKDRLTKIGNDNWILAYAHIAHDCRIGNGVRFVNNATIAGHVTVDDHAILGAFTATHQFCRIGSYSFLSRGTQISKDVPPYMIVEGIPGYPRGLNSVGLRRHGFDRQAMRGLKQAYKWLYMEDLALQDVLQRLKQLAQECPQVGLIVELIESSERGIQRKETRRETA